ncbi:hypothetical protein [Rhodococcus tibetensis]|uniref:Uncharacterized protein n=1 Tax=Rhodococcus tibetensis TaxID=2965064 RepID=A0ABT1QFC2_9NOCA|nr:hypothetical protein [Rhodococcus sp. FXJ9.536]MCQ4120907.1 hypothetical protein [Rhodococcus sp. FXJ9.536]
MNTLPERISGDTERRADRAEYRETCSATWILDESIRLGDNDARLIAVRDAYTDMSYLALLVGNVTGSAPVTVRAVDEEALLIEGSRTVFPEILIGVTESPSASGIGRRNLGRRAAVEGSLRSTIDSIGVHSVIAAWNARA